MSRVVSITATAGLVCALCFGMNRFAIAAPTGIERIDLGSQLMLRLFGENTDSTASFKATQGDRASESPLRDLALHTGPSGQNRDLAGGGAFAFGEERIALNDLSGDRATSFAAPIQLNIARAARFDLPSAAVDSSVFAPPSTHFLAAYQPASPNTSVSPAPGTVAFALPEGHASDYAGGAPQSAAVRFESSDNGASSETPQIALHDASYNAGANVDVRAGKRTVNLNLSSGYDHIGNDTGALSVGATDSASSWQLPGGAPLVIPSASDLNRLSLGAGFSVPVTRGLTLNLNYDAQRLYGGYGLPGLVNLDTVDNSYGGKLTFNIPRISSSLSISAYQDRFQDSIMPLNGYNATREDVNFTVKF